MREPRFDTEASRNADELLQKQRGRAAMLMLVRNGDGHLRAIAIGSDANEATHGYQSFVRVFSGRQYQSDVIAEIDLGQVPKGIRCEVIYRVKKALIDAARG